MSSSLRSEVRRLDSGEDIACQLAHRLRQQCRHVPSVVRHCARHYWSRGPALMSPVHPRESALWGGTLPWGLSRCSPRGRPSPPRLDPQDRSGTPPSAALGLVCPEDILPAAMASLRDPGTPGGVEPQERGITWSPPAGSSVSWTTEDQRNVEDSWGTSQQ